MPWTSFKCIAYVALRMVNFLSLKLIYFSVIKQVCCVHTYIIEFFSTSESLLQKIFIYLFIIMRNASQT